MKKIIMTLACLIITGTMFAQEHLTFKGVPIDGTLREFINAMVDAGCEYDREIKNEACLLWGKFAGYEECLIVVTTSENNNVVSTVEVTLPDRETWTSLKQDYDALKIMLTTKYGTPSKSEEKFNGDKFNGDVGSYNNYFVMEALKEKEYTWYTTFSTKLGDITLSIEEGSENHTGAVIITYTDKLKSKKPSAIDDL